MDAYQEKSFLRRRSGLLSSAQRTYRTKGGGASSLYMICLCLFLFTAYKAIFPSAPIARSQMQALIDDVHRRPIRIEERTSFAQMGARTQVYVNFLKDKNIKEHELDQYEAALWDFVPHVNKIRKNRLHRSRFQRKKSRGIVMTCGKANFEYANHFVATVREVFKSDIPIEIFYYGDEDLSDNMAEFLASKYSNVDPVDFSQRQNPYNESIVQLRNSGWAMKPFALLSSSFDEVMLVDADTVLMMSPEEIFRSISYKETGTLFFQDRLAQCTGKEEVPHEMHKFLRDQFGKDLPKAIAMEKFWKQSCHHYQESGLLLVDLRKPEVLGSLLLTAWMNTGKVREFHTYRRFHGDKESFWLAFELAHQPYRFNKQYGGSIGAEYSPHADGFCSDHLLHFINDIPEKPNTLRRITRKVPKIEGRPAWINGSLRRNKLRVSKELLYPKETIWATDGWWEWMMEEQTYCLRNYTRQPLSSYGMDETLLKLVRTAEEAERSAEDAHLTSGIATDYD